MEVNWGQRQVEGYARDGSLVFQQIIAGNVSGEMVDRGLDLLRTYLSMPTHLQLDSRLDAVMVRLTWALHEQVHQRGDWDAIYLLWPKMGAVACRMPEPAHYAEVTRQLAITKNARGEAKHAQQLYEELVTSTHFAQFTLDQQADILHQAGVCYVEQGKMVEARQVLHHCLTIEESVVDATSLRDKTSSVADKMQKARCAAAVVWESKAYAYNQLGHIALLRRDLAYRPITMKQVYSSFCGTMKRKIWLVLPIKPWGGCYWRNMILPKQKSGYSET